MHIPNGFLDPKFSAGSAFAVAAVLGYCIAKVRQIIKAAVPEAVFAAVGNSISTIKSGIKRTVTANYILRMTAIGSIVFTLQLFDFPILHGTTGHMLGAFMAAVALGPFAGTVTVAAIVFIQAVFMGDGGIAALGVNILNIAVIASFVCYYIYYGINKLLNNKAGYYAGVSIAAFSSIILSAWGCSIFLKLSGVVNIGAVVSSMLSIHAIVGICEVLMTIMILNLLRSINFKLEGIIKRQ